MDYSEKNIYNAINFSKMAYTNFENFIKNSISFSDGISKTEFDKSHSIFYKYEEFKSIYGSKPDLAKNIFSALTPKMHYENVHSRILSFLLNSDSLLMRSFLEMLANSKDAKDKKLNIDLENYKNVLSECEKLKIDVSIKDEESKHAIVIENKINEAVDQEKQMYRYLTKLKEEGYTVDAIVYLVPNVSKNPDYSTYEEQEKEDVEKLFIKLIGYDASKNDLYTIVEKEHKELKDIVKANLKQYGDLLKDKGVVTMNEPIIEKFYEELIKSEENYKNALFVQEMMNNLNIGKFLYFKKTLSDLKFFNKFNDGNEEWHLVIGVKNSNGIHGIDTYFVKDKDYNQKMYFAYEYKIEKKVLELLDKFEDKLFTYKINKKDGINRDGKNRRYVEIASFNSPSDDFSIENFIKKLDEYFYKNYK